MADWITAINDGVSLCEIATPGTHDSASWTHEEVWTRNFTWTQRLNFTEQLDIGIRAFDMRVGWKHRYGSNDIGMFHGVRAVNDQTLDDVLGEMKAWLDNHQGEFLILMFQQQGALGNKSDCSAQVAADVRKHFSGNRFFTSSPHHPTWPTVGQLRNRMMVMERLQARVAGWCDVSPWSDAPTGQLMKVPLHRYVYLQDKYKDVSDALVYNPLWYEAQQKMKFVEAAAKAQRGLVDGNLAYFGELRNKVLKINHTSYSNKKHQPYESGAAVNALLRTKRFRIQGIMMIDDADQATVDHILQSNP
jgi:hypothetical protein